MSAEKPRVLLAYSGGLGGLATIRQHARTDTYSEQTPRAFSPGLSKRAMMVRRENV